VLTCFELSQGRICTVGSDVASWTVDGIRCQPSYVSRNEGFLAAHGLRVSFMVAAVIATPFRAVPRRRRRDARRILRRVAERLSAW
jgi:hypothetical protein